MPPRRTAPIAEQTPRLDVRRLLMDLAPVHRDRIAGFLRIKYGVVVRYRVDRQMGEIFIQVGDMPRWRYQTVAGRGVRCNTCHLPTEMLYWPLRSYDASQGEGRCGACCGVRWLAGYLTGSRASTDRLQPQLRREIRCGNWQGVVRAMARGPREWLAGRQALEDEGLLRRRYTLPEGNRRRWCWRKRRD